jgi:hypothetical protein
MNLIDRGRSCLCVGLFGRTRDCCHGQLGDDVVLLQDESERPEVDDLQHHVALPASMNRWRSQVHEDACPGPRTFAINKTNILGIMFWSSIAQWRSRSDRYIGRLFGLADERDSTNRNGNDLSVRQRDFCLTAAVLKHTTFNKTVDSLPLNRFVRTDGGLILPTAVIDWRNADVLGVVG